MLNRLLQVLMDSNNCGILYMNVVPFLHILLLPSVSFSTTKLFCVRYFIVYTVGKTNKMSIAMMLYNQYFDTETTDYINVGARPSIHKT